MRNVGLFIPDPPHEEHTPDNDYERMTVAQLRAHAEINGVDLGAAKSKADIITILTSVMG